MRAEDDARTHAHLLPFRLRITAFAAGLANPLIAATPALHDLQPVQHLRDHTIAHPADARFEILQCHAKGQHAGVLYLQPVGKYGYEQAHAGNAVIGVRQGIDEHFTHSHHRILRDVLPTDILDFRRQARIAGNEFRHLFQRTQDATPHILSIKEAAFRRAVKQGAGDIGIGEVTVSHFLAAKENHAAIGNHFARAMRHQNLH